MCTADHLALTPEGPRTGRGQTASPKLTWVFGDRFGSEAEACSRSCAVRIHNNKPAAQAEEEAEELRTNGESEEKPLLF